jgi:hypothetical protein
MTKAFRVAKKRQICIHSIFSSKATLRTLMYSVRTCTLYSVRVQCTCQFFFSAIYHIDPYENMGFQHLKSIWNQASGSVDEPLCKTVLWPLGGRRRPSHTTNFKNFHCSKHLINGHIEMSKRNHQKRPELPGGKVM